MTLNEDYDVGLEPVGIKYKIAPTQDQTATTTTSDDDDEGKMASDGRTYIFK